jgi:hypothetical protein
MIYKLTNMNTPLTPLKRGIDETILKNQVLQTQIPDT